MGAAPAQAGGHAAHFNIAAQDLTGALETLARQAGVQILFPYAQANGKRSRAMRGYVPVRRALDQLIAEQGLAVVSFDARRITLGPVQSRPRRDPPSSPPPRRVPPSAMAAPPPAAPDESEILVTGRAVTSRMEPTTYSYAASVID
jgi:hypothetical protein